jgi:hypothetical protein
MLDVAFGLGNVDYESFQFFQVLVGVCEIKTKPIPSLGVLILEVLLKAGFQISGEADIVEAV